MMTNPSPTPSAKDMFPERDYANVDPLNRKLSFKEDTDPDGHANSNVGVVEVCKIMTTLAYTWANTIEGIIEDCEQPWWDAQLNTEEGLCIGFEDGMEDYFGRELDRAKDLAELSLIEYLCKRQGIPIPEAMRKIMADRDTSIMCDLSTFPEGYKFQEDEPHSAAIPSLLPS